MMELMLDLDFSCCSCGSSVIAKIHCKGKGLNSDQAQTVANVSIPCPHCTNNNQVYFKPTGEIYTVCPFPVLRKNYEPSIN